MTRTHRILALVTLLTIPAAAYGQTTVTETKSASRPSIYDVKADAREQIKAARTIARRDNQRILVMFGGDWCGWCHKLHELFAKDGEIRKVLSEDYRLVMVDTKAPNAEAFLAECQGDLKNVGFPFLAVLDADGKILTRQQTDPLEEGDHHDPKKVRAFLEEWAPTKQDAAKVLQAALDRASSEDKRVFLHFGAPWCGWCHKLDGFLAREDVAKLIGKDYVDVKIDNDRMNGAKEIFAKYCKTPGGIPWFAFLDAKGEVLANSDGPKGNIGYPMTADEIAQFVALLKKTARKLDDSDIAAIEKALKAEGEKIESQQRERAAAATTRASSN